MTGDERGIGETLLATPRCFRKRVRKWLKEKGMRFDFVVRESGK